MKQVLLVFLGGGLGSSLRFVIGKLLHSTHSDFPYGTFAVNVVGSLLIGMVLGMALRSDSISQNTLVFITTGFCGGFTTFSAFAYENQLFLKSGDISSFALYTLSSLVIGFAAVFLGVWLAKFL
ncbi:MAG: fluoride efflux transporter CrcB [Flavobacteriales bacterium]|uniref:fluoride efflux transporter CrcB n=1 Tax=Candidatus Ulvibacter alkanivorans TaxID=2267620 RepID=UPI000DF32525|nr:fluoride efflux transporter CrcB [Candidatus Ulvibacter alkanivorans]MCH2489616.1 fluoride efflux transporter CrcB [Flavobacteriales bacterium]